MKRILTAILVTFLMSSCANSQNQDARRLVGGCEGCEAIFEYGDRKLTTTDTLPDFHKRGIKIKVEGTIYLNDGKTPAENVILYAYHTNLEGYYAQEEDAKGWCRRHGYNRGWVKTDENGYYAF